MAFDQIVATVVDNRCLNGTYYLLTLDYETVPRLGQTNAGHFVMLRPQRDQGPLLARPMSILSWKAIGKSTERVEIFYKVHGVGTAQLASLQKNEELIYMGPLGQAFPAIPTQKVLLVGGGVGIPPLVYWCRSHADNPAHSRKLFFMGGRTENDLFYQQELADAGAEVFTATQDGSQGHHGLVTEPFEAILNTLDSDTTVLTCGPMAMMQAVARICEARSVTCFASLEAYMACGYGVCLGCVVPTHDGDFVRVCMEGPVMNTCDIDIHSPFLGAL